MLLTEGARSALPSSLSDLRIRISLNARQGVFFSGRHRVAGETACFLGKMAKSDRLLVAFPSALTPRRLRLACSILPFGAPAALEVSARLCDSPAATAIPVKPLTFKGVAESLVLPFPSCGTVALDEGWEAGAVSVPGWRAAPRRGGCLRPYRAFPAILFRAPNPRQFQRRRGNGRCHFQSPRCGWRC
jgi:hypothetical protein